MRVAMAGLHSATKRSAGKETDGDGIKGWDSKKRAV